MDRAIHTNVSLLTADCVMYCSNTIISGVRCYLSHKSIWSNKMKLSLQVCFPNNHCSLNRIVYGPQWRHTDDVDHSIQDSPFSFFLRVSCLNPAISDPTSAIIFPPMSQLRWWLLQLITTWLAQTKTLLMPEMHVSSVWMSLVTVSGCSLFLHYFKDSISH